MVSTYTPNINLEEPGRGDQVGTWDTPVNNNMSVVDLVTGGIASVPLNNSPVVLSAGQLQAKTITFSSTLTGSVAITFASSFKKSYEIQNLCTGSSAFVVTLLTTVAGGQAICCPPGEIVDVLNDGTNLKYKNLGRIGSHWDYAGSSVPAWVSGCTVPPYLNEDGSAFSAVTYPALAVIIPSLTLPDARGYSRFTLGQGTGRLTTAGAGIDGTAIFAQGGHNGVMLAAAQIPTLAVTSYVQGNPLLNVIFKLASATFNGAFNFSNPGGVGNFVPATDATGWGQTNSITGSYSNAGQAVTPATVPGYVGGITMIRAA